MNINHLGENINNALMEGYKLYDCDHILKEYDGTDWKKYENYSNIEYTRNLAYRNDNIEIFIICWNEKQSSPVHNHPENGCIVKVLKNTLIEECFDNELNKIEHRSLIKNDIFYQKKNDLHRIINDNDKCAASIHIYSPPYYKPVYFDV